MSLSIPVSRMTMRCVIERAVETSKDDYNQPVYTRQELSPIRCFAWVDSERYVYDKDKTGYFETVNLMVELDSDIVSTDIVTIIKDRQENELFTGPFRIVNIMRKHNHQQIAMERTQ